MTCRQIDKCRVCGSPKLVSVIDLGIQYLGGVFPSEKDHLNSLEKAPLELVRCGGECGLLQLRHSCDPDVLFTNNRYGYLSGLNRTMVEHLRNKVSSILPRVKLWRGDCVVDIGSNDGTLLKAYPDTLDLVGFDPGGAKFRQYYPDDIWLIDDFFSAAGFRDEVGRRKAKVVTSIAMFYDLEDPLGFAREVHDILADDGIWVTEQSHMPTMLANCAYDTICHEHIEYYGLAQIVWMAERTGFRIVDIEFNNVNGGSFSVVLTKGTWPHEASVKGMIAAEAVDGDDFNYFTRNVNRSRAELLQFLLQAKLDGKRVLGLGASTKGNTLLQYCGITEELFPCIGDVNEDKWGCFTPGTQIPIVSEDEVLAMRPDYLLVLPWHFRSSFEGNPKYGSSRLVYPLPILSYGSV